ncbi:late embryogenesis abundant protein D-29-like [Cucurbita moschata]|uniref:Late embryogenesis abundant protein D-29-like n=1 Tax=Cucurbita moschata TaxID=3662 RepID=A0A6J1G1V4_CUCMO|nr:late embryogenesis abundant protein D-29-like [Cucurbita moschata]
MASIRVRRRRIILPAVAVAVVVLVFMVSFGRSGSVGHMPSTEEEGRDYQEMKRKMAAKEETEKDRSSETWTEWAKKKISGGLGLRNELREDGVNKIENVVSEAGQYGAEKGREAEDMAAEKAAETAEEMKAKGKAAEETTEKGFVAGKKKSERIKDDVVGSEDEL